MYNFITNNFEISREEVAFLYKLRWNVELLFKKLKQNFQLYYFYSETENGIKTQTWYVDSPVASNGIKSKIRNQESLFNHGRIGKNTRDKQFGCVLDG